MTEFAKGLSTLFGGGADNSAQLAQIAKQREQQQIDIARQKQDLQNQQAEQDAQTGRALRVPRGRRLLLAATGEAGLPSTLG